MKKNAIRVLHGPLETANQMGTLVKGLNCHGVHGRSVNLIKSYLNYEDPYRLEKLWRPGATQQEILAFLKNECMDQFDIFNYHSGYRTFTHGYADVQLLKSEEKPLIIHHWGSEVRVLETALQTNPYAVVKGSFSAGHIDNMLKLLSKNIRYCVVQDMEIYQYVKDYYENIFVVPVMIDLGDYEMDARESDNDRMLIVHAPTDTKIKGTQAIVEVMAQLKDEFAFDFKLIKGYSHTEAKKLYKQADLVIDQLHLGIYGMVSIEAMAMGKPVVCYMSDFMLDHYPDDVPVINANADTLRDVMKSVLRNKDALPDIGKKSRKYVEERHDMLKNSLEVKRIYEQMLS
ncbi:glycosyltransferase [Bacillus sp. FSL W7-1360]